MTTPIDPVQEAIDFCAKNGLRLFYRHGVNNVKPIAPSTDFKARRKSGTHKQNARKARK